MKVLDVTSFQNGLERNVVLLQRVGNEMRAIHQLRLGVIASRFFRARSKSSPKKSVTSAGGFIREELNFIPPYSAGV